MDFPPLSPASCNNVVSRDTLIPLEKNERIHSRAFKQKSATLHSQRSIYLAEQLSLSLATRAMTSLLVCCAHYGITEH